MYQRHVPSFILPKRIFEPITLNITLTLLLLFTCIHTFRIRDTVKGYGLYRKSLHKAMLLKQLQW